MNKLIRLWIIGCIGIFPAICEEKKASAQILSEWILKSDVIIIGKPIILGTVRGQWNNFYSGNLVTEILVEKKDCGFAEISGLVDDDGFFTLEGEHDCEAFILRQKHIIEGESRYVRIRSGIEYCIFGNFSQTSDQEIAAFKESNSFWGDFVIDSKNVLKTVDFGFSCFPAITREKTLSILTAEDFEFYNKFYKDEKSVDTLYEAFDQNFKGLTPPDIINCVKVISKALAQSDQVKIRDSLAEIADTHKIELISATAKHMLEHEGDFPVYVSKPKE